METPPQGVALVLLNRTFLPSLDQKDQSIIAGMYRIMPVAFLLPERSAVKAARPTSGISTLRLFDTSK